MIKLITHNRCFPRNTEYFKPPPIFPPPLCRYLLALSVLFPTTIYHVFYQRYVMLFPGYLLSGYCQVIVRLLSGYCQVIARLLSGYCEVIVRINLMLNKSEIIVRDYHFLTKAALFMICLAMLCLPPPGADVATGAGAGLGGDGEGGRPKVIVIIVILISTTVTWNQPHQNT